VNGGFSAAEPGPAIAIDLRGDGSETAHRDQETTGGETKRDHQQRREPLVHGGHVCLQDGLKGMDEGCIRPDSRTPEVKGRRRRWQPEIEGLQDEGSNDEPGPEQIDGHDGGASVSSTQTDEHAEACDVEGVYQEHEFEGRKFDEVDASEQADKSQDGERDQENPGNLSATRKELAGEDRGAGERGGEDQGEDASLAVFRDHAGGDGGREQIQADSLSEQDEPGEELSDASGLIRGEDVGAKNSREKQSEQEQEQEKPDHARDIGAGTPGDAPEFLKGGGKREHTYFPPDGSERG
jgi:hypothetical protein